MVSAITPRVDFFETDDPVPVTTDLPGIKSEEVEIKLRDHCLVTTAKHDEVREEKKGKNLCRVERRRGRDARSVWLPLPVVEEGVKAKLENGVPKSHVAKTGDASMRRHQVNR